MNRLSFTLLGTVLLLALGGATAHAQGTIRATTTIHDDGSKSVTILDPDKMTAEETVSDMRGRTLRKVTYVLDEQNQPIGSITYDGKGVVQYRTSFKRDGAGRIDEENVTSATGVFLRRRVYTYGAQNKVTNVVEYDAQGNMIQVPRRGKAVPAPGRRK